MEPDKKSSGELVGLVIIIIILVIGGIYIWHLNRKAVMERQQMETVTSEDTTELNKLEMDIETTDTETGVDVNTVD